jgi:hypothetical protein
MDRVPRAQELTSDELASLRRVVANSFTPSGHINQLQQKHLIELGLIQCAMGGLMPTPTGRIVARR